MDTNNQVETVDTTAETDVTTEGMQDAFDSGWDDDGQAGEVEEVTETTEDTGDVQAEADQQEPKTTPNDTKADAQFILSLKRHDEVREMDLSKPEVRDEAIALMQKGWDYDHKTQKLNGKIAEYEEFLKELADPMGLSLEQLMDSTRARLYRDKEKKAGKEISETDALLKVQRDRAAKKETAETQAKETADAAKAKAEADTSRAIQAFMREYKDVKAEDIPQEVWAEFRRTGDLISAYARHEVTKLRAENEALKQNAKNASRSTGSTKSEGSGKHKSAFEEGWDSI